MWIVEKSMEVMGLQYMTAEVAEAAVKAELIHLLCRLKRGNGAESPAVVLTCVVTD